MTKSSARTLTSLVSALVPLTQALAAAPQAEITNGLVHVEVYLPDAVNGFYRGTRFDWSGIVKDLRYQGHSYYGPWFAKTDPNVRDFVYAGPDIIVGPCTAATGPAEEFASALGYSEAKPGGTFVKVGVGVLRKPTDTPYDSFHLYELVDGGTWTVEKSATSITFRQEVHDSASGYGYIYKKTLKLLEGKPDMLIEHTLRNVGIRPIHLSTYNHNFLVLDQQPPGPAYTITFPFTPAIDEALNAGLATTKSDQILFLKVLTGKERVYSAVGGSTGRMDDYKIRIDNADRKVGMSISGDRPLAKMALWSIRSVLAAEPFIDIAVEPNKESTWTFRYEYYTLPNSH